jgi:hypothetical protein
MKLGSYYNTWKQGNESTCVLLWETSSAAARTFISGLKLGVMSAVHVAVVSPLTLPL